MGADLYINSLFNAREEKFMVPFEKACKKRDSAKFGSPEYDKSQAEVAKIYDELHSEECYFRDSYNNSSLFWRLGLSWWADVTPLLDPEGYLSVKNAKVLRETVETAPLSLLTEQEAKDLGDDWHDFNKYLLEKRKRLIAFLSRAICMDEPIYCSV